MVVDKTTFEAGFVEVLFKTKMFCVDSSVEYDDLISALGGSGYIRCPSVSSPGDYSVRGSVVDFFPNESARPVRVDFSYNSPSVYFFHIDSQITFKKIPRISFILSAAGRKNISLSQQVDGLSLFSLSFLKLPFPNLPR